MCARGGAAGVVGVDGEGLVLGIIVVGVLRLSVDFGQGHSTTGANATSGDTACSIAEDVAL